MKEEGVVGIKEIEEKWYMNRNTFLKLARYFTYEHNVQSVSIFITKAVDYSSSNSWLKAFWQFEASVYVTERNVDCLK